MFYFWFVNSINCHEKCVTHTQVFQNPSNSDTTDLDSSPLEQMYLYVIVNCSMFRKIETKG